MDVDVGVGVVIGVRVGVGVGVGVDVDADVDRPRPRRRRRVAQSALGSPFLNNITNFILLVFVLKAALVAKVERFFFLHTLFLFKPPEVP